jgi:hypothetical protein
MSAKAIYVAMGSGGGRDVEGPPEHLPARSGIDMMLC